MQRLRPHIIAEREAALPRTDESGRQELRNLKQRNKVEDQQETIAQLKSDATKQEAATIELKSTVAQQQKAMEILTAQLQEQASQIQRVNAQLAAASPSRGGLELNKFARGQICRRGPAPQTVGLSTVTLREGGNNP